MLANNTLIDLADILFGEDGRDRFATSLIQDAIIRNAVPAANTLMRATSLVPVARSLFDPAAQTGPGPLRAGAGADVLRALSRRTEILANIFEAYRRIAQTGGRESPEFGVAIDLARRISHESVLGLVQIEAFANTRLDPESLGLAEDIAHFPLRFADIHGKQGRPFHGDEIRLALGGNGFGQQRFSASGRAG